MKNFIKHIFAFVISFAVFCSCDTNTKKHVDYSEIGGVDIVTYQVTGDKPHQYIRFGYVGYGGYAGYASAHYPECKYCKENNDSIK